ncbi:hypothetical protein BG011_006746 [Mortierella polycephala]|uniref:tRNA ligase n=1 Tax=Mortierella polycephala TaxID=41804 RepID=A0A9P6TZI2_9FUNG|nr:hypothetical protein BG011_006746 [Mortierella polycephala]
MNQLTNQLVELRLEDATITKAGDKRIKDDIISADKLIRRLCTLAENKTKGASSRGRSLVYGNKFDLDLRKVARAPLSSVASTSRDTQGFCEHSNSNNNSNKDWKLEVTSWNMNEFEYANGSLPTMARGLFTYQNPTYPLKDRDEDDTRMQTPPGSAQTAKEDIEASEIPHDNKGTYRILIRGYDKFFNVGEVKTTRPEWIASETEGPYEVTLKENGCIIFMAGLPPHLVGPEGGCVVSSKHFLGDSEHKGGAGDAGIHAIKGREWLEKSLASKGKTLQEFGLWLWNENVTAVAELCDDSFEEHVLEYPLEKSGLYLHGLNRNTAEFETLPSVKVQETAATWGFQRTDFVTFKTHQEVMDFADKVKNAGEYDNRAVEGFVVRCKSKKQGATHFFKIKYDEPYLMYREWREITKHLLSVAAKKAAAEAKKAAAQVEEGKKQSKSTAKAVEMAPDVKGTVALRMRYPLTRPYVEFVKDLMTKQPELFTGYNKNQGIIAIRDMFLKEWESRSSQEQGSSLAISPTTSKLNAGTVEDFQRTVLIPIATIACGKTTVSVALSQLFGWAHVSSDDFFHTRKNAGQKFIKEVINQLWTNAVVIADRNNFEYMHRERIMESVLAEFPRTRFVALYWSHDNLPDSRILELEIERVKDRGSNHQSLTPEYCPEFESVIQRFLRCFEPLNPMVKPDSGFNHVVESKIGEESLVFVQRIVKEFVIPTFGAGGIGNRSIPKLEEIKEAVRYALNDWKPKRVMSGEVEKFYKDKLVAQAKQQQPTEVAGAAGAPGEVGGTTSTTSRKKEKEPKFFAIALERGSVLQFLEDIFGEGDVPAEHTVENITRSKVHEDWTRFRDQFTAWKAENRVSLAQHVTLIHVRAREDPSPTKAQRAEGLWKQYTEEIGALMVAPSTSTTSTIWASLPASPSSSPSPDGFSKVTKESGGRDKDPTAVVTSVDSLSDIPDLRAAVAVDYIIWTERIITLRVSSAIRTCNKIPYGTTQPILHVTVGTAGGHVKPYESNEVLQQWSSRTKHSTTEVKENASPEIFSIKLDKAKIFTGNLKAMLY